MFVHFIRPYWLLLLIPLAFICWRLWRYHSQKNAWQEVCDPHLLPHLLVGTHSPKQRWPLVLLATSWLVAVIALAGPTWHKIEQPIYQAQAAHVLVLDLSPSMYATDLKPSRIERAKFKILDILQRFKEGQIGMIVFTSQAFIVSPLTQDANTIASQINVLDPSIAPVSGANIAPALKKAATLIKQAGFKQGQILLITDSTPDNAAFQEAKQLHAENIDTSVLGIGTNEGAPVALPEGGFLKDEQGAILLEKLDTTQLAELAQAGGGNYRSLTADNSDIEALLARASNIPRADNLKKSSQVINSWQDQGCWLLLILLPLALFAFKYK